MPECWSFVVVGWGAAKKKFERVGWQKCLVATNKFWGVQKICGGSGGKKIMWAEEEGRRWQNFVWGYSGQ